MGWNVNQSLADETAAVLVAVYGTLKRGLGNFHLLAQADFVGTDVLHEITLYDTGPYPGARLESSDGIEVEIFAVDPVQMAALDVLEDYNAEAPDLGLYDRQRLQTRYGPAWIYLYNFPVADFPAIRCGSW